MKRELFKKPIHYRELIIAASIAITMIILGSFFDKDVSHYLYGADKKPYFSYIMSGIAEMPTYLTLVFIGCLLIFCAPQENKKIKILVYIFSVLVILFGGFFAVDTTKNIYLTAGETGKLKLIVTIVASIFVVLITGFLAYVANKIARNPDFDKHYIFKCAFVIFIVTAMQLIFVNVTKIIASRPRPYLIFADNMNVPFRNWYESWQPFYAFKMGDAFMSFPSGHTATASTFAAILPIYFLMSNRCRDSRKLQVGGFYIGLGWGLITAYARICCGCHFLSDTGWGLLFTVISIFITLCIVDIHLTREKHYEKA